MLRLPPSLRSTALLMQPAGAGAAFSPSAIAGLQLWLDATTGVYQDAARTTPAVADGDPVGGWADQSGVGNHASQGTAAARPTLKLAIQNGRNVLRFDGVDDVLSLGNLSALFPTAGTLFVVYTPNDGDGQYTVFTDGTTDSYWRFNDGNSYFGTWRAARVETYPNPGLPNANVALQVTVQSSAVAYTVWQNGVSAGAQAANYSNAGIAYTVGHGTRALGGDIAEVLAYSAALSAADRQRVEAFLKTRWNTP